MAFQDVASKRMQARLAALAWAAALVIGGSLSGCSDDGSTDDNGTPPQQYADVQFVDAGAFLPPKPTVSICNPCNATLQCNGIDDKDAHCVDYGDEGAFCGAGCASDGECTEGYRCADVKSVEGLSVKQCVRKADAGSKGAYGVCPC